MMSTPAMDSTMEGIQMMTTEQTNSHPTPDEIWAMKLGSVKAPMCHACGSSTRWGIAKFDLPLCDEHNTWMAFLRIILSRAICQR